MSNTHKPSAPQRKPLTDGKFLKRTGKLALAAIIFVALFISPALTLILLIVAGFVFGLGMAFLGLTGLFMAFTDVACALLRSAPSRSFDDLPCAERRSTSQHPVDWTADQ